MLRARAAKPPVASAPPYGGLTPADAGATGNFPPSVHICGHYFCRDLRHDSMSVSRYHARPFSR